MSSTPEEIFEKMGAQIENNNKRIASLQKLLSEMQKVGENVFTQDEVELTTTVLNSTIASNDSLRAELSKKIEIYEQKVVFMQRQLEERQRIIEAFEGESQIEDTDPLYELLVKTHAKISAEHKAATEQIS